MPRNTPMKTTLGKRYKRALRALYYRSGNAMPDDWDNQGFPASEIGVVRGAVVRIMLGEYDMARIYDTTTGRMKMSLHAARKGHLPEVRYGGQNLGVAQLDGTIRYGTK